METQERRVRLCRRVESDESGASGESGVSVGQRSRGDEPLRGNGVRRASRLAPLTAPRVSSARSLSSPAKCERRGDTQRRACHRHGLNNRRCRDFAAGEIAHVNTGPNTTFPLSHAEPVLQVNGKD
ncbi:unnamed protein product, partial [Iphiclides podalirius]